MTRRKPVEPVQDESLMDATLTPTGERRKVGRTERRVYRAIRAARDRGVVEDLEDPLASTALDLARSIDWATSTKPDPYAVAACSRELLKVLDALQFTKPRESGASNPELDAFLKAMSEAQ